MKEHGVLNPNPITSWECWYFRSNPVTTLSAWDSLPWRWSLAFTRRCLHSRSLSRSTETTSILRRQTEAKGKLVVRVWKELFIIHPFLPQINFKNLSCFCKTVRSQTNADSTNFLPYIFETSKPVMSEWACEVGQNKTKLILSYIWKYFR